MFPLFCLGTWRCARFSNFTTAVLFAFCRFSFLIYVIFICQLSSFAVIYFALTVCPLLSFTKASALPPSVSLPYLFKLFITWVKFFFFLVFFGFNPNGTVFLAMLNSRNLPFLFLFIRIMNSAGLNRFLPTSIFFLQFSSIFLQLFLSYAQKTELPHFHLHVFPDPRTCPTTRVDMLHIAIEVEWLGYTVSY